MMWPMHDGWGWGWGTAWSWIGLLAIAALFIWTVVRLATREPNRRDEPQPLQPDALTLLKLRYARGELSDEQFEAMRGRLESSIPYDMT
jgi:uncharacterized membrane protein